jgi:hypothetical protein
MNKLLRRPDVFGANGTAKAHDCAAKLSGCGDGACHGAHKSRIVRRSMLECLPNTIRRTHPSYVPRHERPLPRTAHRHRLARDWCVLCHQRARLPRCAQSVDARHGAFHHRHAGDGHAAHSSARTHRSVRRQRRGIAGRHRQCAGVSSSPASACGARPGTALRRADLDGDGRVHRVRAHAELSSSRWGLF